MITVAVAARTMDRHARYRSLLPIREYTLLSALDCATLARLIKTRPVGAIIFDLQKPAMPAEDWLDMLTRDQELNTVATIWVGRDVAPSLLERAGKLGCCLTVPPRPDSETLIAALRQAAAFVASTRGQPGEIRSRGTPAWRPEEDIIDQALSIFDHPAPTEESPRSAPQPDWQVSELASPPGTERGGKQATTVESHTLETAALKPEPEPPISLNVEEFGTAKFAVPPELPAPPNDGVVNERILPTDTDLRLNGPPTGQPGLVERLTTEVIADLARRLADELVSRIDPQMVRAVVEEKLQRPTGR